MTDVKSETDKAAETTQRKLEHADDVKLQRAAKNPNSHGVGTFKISRDGYIQRVRLAFLPQGMAYYSGHSGKRTTKRKRA